MIKTKFKVQTKTETPTGSTIKLVPIILENTEDTEFMDGVVGGILEIITSNLKTSDNFKVGDEYYIDFTLLKDEKSD